MSLEEEKKEKKNEGVRDLLNEKHRDEMSKILAFGEKYKEEGEKMKKEFWKDGDRKLFVKLLMQYRDNKKEYMEYLTEEEKDILDKLNEVGKDKFIEACLHDKILFNGDKDKKIERKKYGYNEWKDRKVVMKEGVYLDLRGNNIGAEGAEAISKMELKEGVMLDLGLNEIGDAGAEAISKMELKEGVELNLGSNNIGNVGAEALSKMKLKKGVELSLGINHIGPEGAEAISKMELKEGVQLDLGFNEIGDAGAEAISKMKLKEGVVLNLIKNEIGDAGAEAIMKNMELKDGVILNLLINCISEDMKGKLKKWVQGYKDKGVNCTVYV